MKLPSTLRSYCPHCRSHQEHEVSLPRRGKERTLSLGRRKYKAVKAGYGGSPRTPKKDVYKTGKKVVVVLSCKACKRKRHQSFGFRAKRKLEVE